MSGKATGWVIKHFPIRKAADRNRKIILISVADAANQHGEGSQTSISAICDEWGFDQATVSRHLSALVEEGWLEVQSKAQGRGGARIYRIPKMADPNTPQNAGESPAQNARQSDAITASSEPKLRGNNSDDTFLSITNGFTEERAEDPIHVAAHAIAKRVFELVRDPAPLTPFPGVLSIAKKCLKAKHKPEAIIAAMVAVPTISSGWVESELNKRARSVRHQKGQDKNEMIMGWLDKQEDRE